MLLPRADADRVAGPFWIRRYYQPVRELIRQSLGQVYLAVNKETGQEVVVKLIERGPTVSRHVESELLLHRHARVGALRWGQLLLQWRWLLLSVRWRGCCAPRLQCLVLPPPPEARSIPAASRPPMGSAGTARATANTVGLPAFLPPSLPLNPCRKCTGHPNIIQLIEVFLTPHYLAIVLEYAPGGDLLDYVTTKGRLSEDEARWFFQQLVMGLAYFHRY